MKFPAFLFLVAILQACAPVVSSPGHNMSSVTVAVIDTGIVDHKDFSEDLFLPGYDFVHDENKAQDGDGRDSDPTDPAIGLRPYHGTQMAGLVQRSFLAASPDSYAEYLQIMPLRVLGRVGCDPLDISDAILFAAGYETSDGHRLIRPVDIINLSLSTPDVHPAVEFAVQKALESGVVIVAGAGNEGKSSVGYPAAYPGVIAVSSIGSNGKVPEYANHSDRVDLYAPGGGDYVEGGPYDGIPAPSYVEGKQWHVYSYGTSTATAVTSGVIASLFVEDKAVPRRELIHMVKNKLPAVGVKLWSLHQKVDK